MSCGLYSTPSFVFHSYQHISPFEHVVAHSQPTMSNTLKPASTGQNSSTMMSGPPIQRASPFEELPIEIQIMILHSMPSPKDLYATIRASPTALGAFSGRREAILLSVLERHISPEIFCHYLALLTMPKYADFNFVAALYTQPHPPQFTDQPRADKNEIAIPTWDTTRPIRTKWTIVKNFGGKLGVMSRMTSSRT